MSVFELLIFGAIITLGSLVILIFLLPPISYLSQRASLWFDSTVIDYSLAWFGRAAFARRQREQRRSKREFLNWLQTRVNGELDGDQGDELLIEAQRLTPLLRYLLQEEIPDSIRRCNALHRRIALLSGALHMRDIAFEPECLGLRRWMSNLLANTEDLLQQYPLRLRIEADDLLNASIVVRKSLLPICQRCPYVERTVAAAGERCPAAELIQLEDHRK